MRNTYEFMAPCEAEACLAASGRANSSSAQAGKKKRDGFFSVTYVTAPLRGREHDGKKLQTTLY